MPVEVAAGRLLFLGAKTRTQATAPGIRGMRGTSGPQPGPDDRCLRLLRNATCCVLRGVFCGEHGRLCSVSGIPE